jgi:hypothetical protein
MRRKDCSQVRRYPYKRGHLVALQADEDIRHRSAVDVVAGREVKRLLLPLPVFHALTTQFIFDEVKAAQRAVCCVG